MPPIPLILRIARSAAFFLAASFAAAAAQAPGAQWLALHGETARLYERGEWRAALPAVLQEVDFAKSIWGVPNFRTLTSLADEGLIHIQLGQLGDAQRVLETALSVALNVLGPAADLSSSIRAKLARVYREIGRIQDAEDLLDRSVRNRQWVIAQNIERQIEDMNSLGNTYRAQGSLAQAKAIFEAAFAESRMKLGPENRLTLSLMNNLAEVLQTQGQAERAFQIYAQVIPAEQKLVEPTHPVLLTMQDNFGTVLGDLGRYAEAAQVLTETLRLRRLALGPGHPRVIGSMNNLAGVLREANDLAGAEKLLREALSLANALPGAGERVGRLSAVNLATLLARQGAFAEAEPLIRETLERDIDVLGREHLDTRGAMLNLITMLAAQGRVAQAVPLVRDLEESTLQWLGTELYGSEHAQGRRHLVASQETYQNLALSLALLQASDPADARDTAGLAASALLRFKNLAVEEEASLARLIRKRGDPRVVGVGQRIAQLHHEIATLVHSEGSRDRVAGLMRDLDSKEFELGQLSREYATQLEVWKVTLPDVQQQLPQNGALLELRAYRPIDMAAQRVSEEVRWAGVLITPGEVRVRDLGLVSAIEPSVRGLQVNPVDPEALRSLYLQLIAPFDAELQGMDRIYVAPDGPLYLVPFGLLRGPDGRSHDFRLVQTGRDLLRPIPPGTARGLVAMGGIDFDAAADPDHTAVAPANACTVPLPVSQPTLDVPVSPRPGSSQIAYARDAARATAKPAFKMLAHSAQEVAAVAQLYCAARPDEPVELDTGPAARKARLLHLPAPPRVLHLATHGFYDGARALAELPLLMSGVALAGANAPLGGAGELDGFLYGLEALDLDLNGTELVILSACDTAQGYIDYGEGISGLVRAFRTAGARAVLVTLRPVRDEAASTFVQRFYEHWLGAAHGDAGLAMRLTSNDYVQGSASTDTGPSRGAAPIIDPPIAKPDESWASFILIGL